MHRVLVLESGEFGENISVALEESHLAKVSKASNVRDVLATVRSSTRFDFALIHYHDDPEMEATSALAGSIAHPKVVVYSGRTASEDAMHRALEAGAWCYLYRESLVRDFQGLLDQIRDLTELQTQFLEDTAERRWLLHVVENLGSGIGIVDRHCRVWYMNCQQKATLEKTISVGDRYCILTGGKPLSACCSGCDMWNELDALTVNPDTGPVRAVRPCLIAGQVKYLETFTTPLMDSGGTHPIAVIECVNDITTAEKPHVIRDENELSEELDKKLAGTLDAIRRLGYGRARTFLVSPEGTELSGYMERGGGLKMKCFNGYGFPVSLDPSYEATMALGPTKGVIVRRTQSQLEDPIYVKLLVRPFDKEFIDHWLEFPLCYGDTAIGKLIVDNWGRHTQSGDIVPLSKRDADRLAPFADMAALQIGSARAHREYLESVQVIDRLRRLDQNIWSEARSLEEMLQIIIETAIQFTQSSSGHIRIKKGTELALCAGDGFIYERICKRSRQSIRVDDANSVLAKAVREKSFVRSDDTRRQNDWYALMTSSGISKEERVEMRKLLSQLAMPIATDRVLGVLSLESEQPGFFTDNMCHFVQEFCSRSALAIERWLADEARLDRQTEKAQLDAWQDYVSQASHRLNNPRSVVSGTARIGLKMIDDGADSSQIRELFARLDRQAKQLDRVVTDMTRFRRQVAVETRELRPTVCDLPTALDEFLSELLDDRATIKWSVSKPRTPLRILVDFGVLSEIIAELVMNAEKYGGRDNLQVDIAVRRAGASVPKKANLIEGEKYVRLDVRNSGVPVPAEMKTRMFRPFQTGDERLGTGMGLAIVRRQVMLLRGYIDEYSKRSEGAHFRIFLPEEAREE